MQINDKCPEYFLVRFQLLALRQTPNLEDQGVVLSGPSPADQPGLVEPARSKNSCRHSSGDHKGTQASWHSTRRGLVEALCTVHLAFRSRVSK